MASFLLLNYSKLLLDIHNGFCNKFNTLISNYIDVITNNSKKADFATKKVLDLRIYYKFHF